MIKKIVFCLILLCCMSSIAFAENPSDNVNETTNNGDISPNTGHIIGSIDIDEVLSTFRSIERYDICPNPNLWWLTFEDSKVTIFARTKK